MKFVNRHHTDIVGILKQKNFDVSAFDFIKRRGRICIKYSLKPDVFCYLRKKETRLDPITGQWTDLEWFKVKSGKSPETTAESWKMVMHAFEKWLSQFQPGDSSQN